MPGHPALDIWTMVYSATDADYRFLDAIEVEIYENGYKDTDKEGPNATNVNYNLIMICTFIKTWSDFRALHLEEDLKAYFNVLSGYMEEKADFKEFRQELEERRMKGVTMDCKFILSSC